MATLEQEILELMSSAPDEVQEGLHKLCDVASQYRIAGGMKTMFQDGLARVFFAETNLEEVLRVAL
jgi:hypothetical protein